MIAKLRDWKKSSKKKKTLKEEEKPKRLQKKKGRGSGMYKRDGQRKKERGDEEGSWFDEGGVLQAGDKLSDMSQSHRRRRRAPK
ncbi:hypothetical protein L228DRAFT_242731 [Xylona heveae TC161]|uniref:Uncharacterized protein n=1 Tax=Xylona heveae (strain CBS 132557 / TC161) TaxID=1328760 RepID=A0A165JIH6_XYLHT|nr:hypothetical protein L228DRAFT_242731 [Xylona heveae TC161]KZF26284.1 hypothetical protein L228DRAFT_242731 [Xylona heveae TC161]